MESSKLRRINKKFSHLLDQANKSSVKKAAVLIAIFQYDGKPHVILTERSKSLRTHAGQVALPGGKVDDSDSSIADAAIREAEEEIGLLSEHVQVVGTSLPVYSSVAELIVYPVVGYISNIADVRLNISNDEVASIFAAPLQVFCETSQYTTHGKYRFPKVEWNCHNYGILNSDMEESETVKQLLCSDKKYVIWGITAAMLDIYSAIFFDRTPRISIQNSIPSSTLNKNSRDSTMSPMLLVGKL